MSFSIILFFLQTSVILVILLKSNFSKQKQDNKDDNSKGSFIDVLLKWLMKHDLLSLKMVDYESKKGYHGDGDKTINNRRARSLIQATRNIRKEEKDTSANQTASSEFKNNGYIQIKKQESSIKIAFGFVGWFFSFIISSISRSLFPYVSLKIPFNKNNLVLDVNSTDKEHYNLKEDGVKPISTNYLLRLIQFRKTERLIKKKLLKLERVIYFKRFVRPLSIIIEEKDS